MSGACNGGFYCAGGAGRLPKGRHPKSCLQGRQLRESNSAEESDPGLSPNVS